MSTLHTIYDPILPTALRKLAGDPLGELTVIDVGASGGIDQIWRHFEPRFRAVGFDPLVPEVERLNAAESNANVRYEAAFVGARDYSALFPESLRSDRIASKSNESFNGTSARRAMDAIADILWAPDEVTASRLRREGHAPGGELPTALGI